MGATPAFVVCGAGHPARCRPFRPAESITGAAHALLEPTTYCSSFAHGGSAVSLAPALQWELAVRREGGQNRQQLLCELPDGTLIVIPKWMTEVDGCASLSVGSPQVSVA